jgi:hypothetical protein
LLASPLALSLAVCAVPCTVDSSDPLCCACEGPSGTTQLSGVKCAGTCVIENPGTVTGKNQYIQGTGASVLCAFGSRLHGLTCDLRCSVLTVLCLRCLAGSFAAGAVTVFSGGDLTLRAGFQDCTACAFFAATTWPDLAHFRSWFTPVVARRVNHHSRWRILGRTCADRQHAPGTAECCCCC